MAVLRSTDGGTTKLPLTAGCASWASFTANANEPVSEECVSGASYWLSLAPVFGTISYQVQQ